MVMLEVLCYPSSMNSTKGELTRARILEAATLLFYKNGVYNVTCAAIATAAGLTQPAIYRHFDTLEDILIEAAQTWVVEAQLQIDAKLKDEPSARVQLRSMISENFKYSSANRSKDALLLSLLQHALSSPSAKRIYSALKSGGEQRFKVLIEKGNRDKSWRVKSTTEKSRAIHNLLLAEILKMILDPREMPLAARTELVWAATECILRSS